MTSDQQLNLFLSIPEYKESKPTKLSCISHHIAIHKRRRTYILSISFYFFYFLRFHSRPFSQILASTTTTHPSPTFIPTPVSIFAPPGLSIELLPPSPFSLRPARPLVTSLPMAETPSKRPREQSEEKNLERAEGDESEDAKRHHRSRYLRILATFLLEEAANDLAAGTTSPADDLSSFIATLQRELSDSDSVPPPTEQEEPRPSQVRVDVLIGVHREELGIPSWVAESEEEEERVVVEYEEVVGPGFWEMEYVDGFIQREFFMQKRLK